MRPTTYDKSYASSVTHYMISFFSFALFFNLSFLEGPVLNSVEILVSRFFEFCPPESVCAILCLCQRGGREREGLLIASLREKPG